MTPSLFFRLMSWFAAGIGCLMTGLAVVSMVNGQPLPGLLLLVMAVINFGGWRLFTTWSDRMRG